MKTVWVQLIFSLAFSGMKAQLPEKQQLLQSFSATDSGSYWLISTKMNSPTLSNYPGIQVMRRLSSSSFIIKGKLPAIGNLIERISLANNNWKLSPRLLDIQPVLPTTASHNFYVSTDSIVAVKNKMDNYRTSIRVLYENNNTLLVRTTYETIKKIFLPDDRVVFIDLADRNAKEEASINGFDYTLNHINTLHQLYPAYDGKKTTVSVKENRPDTADIDFKSRYLPTTATASTLSSHATIMSTIIAGAGNSFYTAGGVAPAAAISSSSFDVLLPDSDAYYNRYNISVQNHSYGTGIENFYGADAAAYDASVNTNPFLLHVFSSGNAGDQASSNSAFAGIRGFANLTGSFKMAKNIISVGSADSFAAVPLLSSKGPAYDGRLKPDLVAYGEDGSSGAAALVSGTALVLQDIYKKQHADSLPDAALVKTVLLNSAGDAETRGIDFNSGYGCLDALRAATLMNKGSFFTGRLANGQATNFGITVPANAKNLKIMLGWTDPPAAANAFIALVNDLDLTVTNNANNQHWLPWVLSSYPNKDSLQLLPVRKKDSLNNQEQVTIDDPSEGAYTITVQAAHVTNATQKFFVVFQWDTLNTFQWIYPVANDNLLPGKQQVLRWNNQYDGNGTLEYSYVGSGNWQTINSAVPLSTRWIHWTPPDTNAVAMLRMTINGQVYPCDTFTISAPLQPGVGYNCADEALLYWNKTGANRYQAYKLGKMYMELFKNTTDSFLIINKHTDAGGWFSIAPLLPFNKPGIHSIAFDYTAQGVDCYLKSFTADPDNGTGKLGLSFGSTYQIKNISIEKMGTNGLYQPWKIITPPFSLQYNFTDASLVRGANQYRLRIDLQNGTIIHSDVQTIYFTGTGDYVVYPNPVSRPQLITIVSKQLNNAELQLFNVYGQKLTEKKLFNLTEQLMTASLARGVYFYVIAENGKKVYTGKLVVR
jgi:hypothetical protein